jgi:hypothetical protein
MKGLYVTCKKAVSDNRFTSCPRDKKNAWDLEYGENSRGRTKKGGHEVNETEGCIVRKRREKKSR